MGHLSRIFRAPSVMPIYSPNPMSDHLLESSHRDDSNKWSNIGFGKEILQVESIKVKFTRLIWSSGIILDGPTWVKSNTRDRL